MVTDTQSREAPATPTAADAAPRALCIPGWAYLANLIGLTGVLLILVGEMLETGRWRGLMVACLFIGLVMLQFVAFWVAGRRPAGAESERASLH